MFASKAGVYQSEAHFSVVSSWPYPQTSGFKTLATGLDVIIQFFPSSLTLRHNKLVRLYLENIADLVFYLQRRQETL